MMVGPLLLIFGVLLSMVDGKIEVGTIPTELQSMYDNFKGQTTVLKTPGESIDYFCTEQYMWTTAGQRWPRANFTTESYNWLVALGPDSNDLRPGKKRAKRQVLSRRTRREYRMMSEQERNDFHRAINMLKEDTLTVKPSKYEVLAELHTGVRSLAAYGGPAFFPFHRVFLYMFENALREKVPGVTIPYWDYSLDADLPNPADSIVWSSSFFGPGNGLVTSGPFANWKLSSGPLVRNLGSGGPLMTHRDIELILEQPGLDRLTYPTGGLTNIEFLHAGLYRHIGGQMGSLETSAQDPAFFPAHAFIDRLWEDVREKQLSFGINPEDDYPVNYGSPHHGPNELMGLGQFRNIEGLSNFFSDIIRYESLPRCSSGNQDCGTPYLRCNTINFRCEAIDTDSITSCSMRGLNRPTQNVFSINGRGDVDQWAYLPVKVIYSRPPEFRDYGSYPITNGAAQYNHDLYSPYAYTATRSLARDSVNSPRGWSSCRTGGCCGGSAEVYVQSTGLNYDGFYKDNALVDQRFAISSSVTYVAVKHPMRGMSTAMLRAYDSCGRMCAAACKVAGSNPERYELCNGVITVTSGAPYMFGNNFGESLMGAWDFSVNRNAPTFRENEIFMAFYCDYSSSWPFEADGRRQTVPQPTVNVALNLGTVHDAHENHGFGGIHRAVPLGLNKCKIDDVCNINRKCSGCRNGAVVKCNNGCRSFVLCEYGEWTVRRCGVGHFFNSVVNQCSVGNCVSTATGIRPKQDPLTSAINMINPAMLGLVTLMKQKGNNGNVNNLTSLLAWASILKQMSRNRRPQSPQNRYNPIDHPGFGLPQEGFAPPRQQFVAESRYASPFNTLRGGDRSGMLATDIGANNINTAHVDHGVGGHADHAIPLPSSHFVGDERRVPNRQGTGSWLDRLLG